MARPTLAEQLQKAIAEGDIEKAKELADRLADKTKTSKKKILVVKNKKPKKTKPKPIEEDDEVTYDYDYDNDEDDPTTKSREKFDSSFVVSARDPRKQQKYIDEEGKERNRSRIIPFDTRKKKNKWKDNENEFAQDIEFDQKVHAKGVRKGQPRPTVKKIKIRCTRCGDIKVLWQGEVMHKNYVCDGCLTSNKPGR